MQAVSINEVVRIHDRIVSEIGGSLGVREPGLLAAVAEKPQASFGGQELYSTVFDKAAALHEALVNYHVFVDGNKRTAITTLEYFLYRNGFLLTASKKEKERFTLRTATDNPDLINGATWIKRHANKVIN